LFIVEERYAQTMCTCRRELNWVHWRDYSWENHARCHSEIKAATLSVTVGSEVAKS